MQDLIAFKKDKEHYYITLFNIKSNVFNTTHYSYWDNLVVKLITNYEGLNKRLQDYNNDKAEAYTYNRLYPKYDANAKTLSFKIVRRLSNEGLKQKLDMQELSLSQKVTQKFVDLQFYNDICDDTCCDDYCNQDSYHDKNGWCEDNNPTILLKDGEVAKFNKEKDKYLKLLEFTDFEIYELDNDSYRKTLNIKFKRKNKDTIKIIEE
jgi:hypothetical protein